MKFDPVDDVPFTRSVSEFTRQMEELMESRNPEPQGKLNYHNACQRIRDLRRQVENIKLSKAVRQPLFKELRELESFWGICSIPYNGG